MLFTREQIKNLENIGQTIKHFHTVTESGFKRGTLLKEDNAVADIYEQATGQKVLRQFGCKTCNFNFYRKAAELYFESKRYYDNEDKLNAIKEANETAQAATEIVEMIGDIISIAKRPATKKTTTKTNKKTTKTKKK